MTARMACFREPFLVPAAKPSRPYLASSNFFRPQRGGTGTACNMPGTVLLLGAKNRSGWDQKTFEPDRTGAGGRCRRARDRASGRCPPAPASRPVRRPDRDLATVLGGFAPGPTPAPGTPGRSAARTPRSSGWTRASAAARSPCAASRPPPPEPQHERGPLPTAKPGKTAARPAPRIALQALVADGVGLALLPWPAPQPGSPGKSVTSHSPSGPGARHSVADRSPSQCADANCRHATVRRRLCRSRDRLAVLRVRGLEIAVPGVLNGTPSAHGSKSS
jgi:hypothetical protein